MSLPDAWIERLKLISEAKVHQSKALNLDKDRFTAPRNAKVSVWFASMSAYYEGEFEREQGTHLMFHADQLWHDAVLAARGPIRMEWLDVTNKGWKCVLETGEEFEP